jgi:hypothetical protein
MQLTTNDARTVLVLVIALLAMVAASGSWRA